MSRSQPVLTNPTERHFEYTAKEGRVRYWDKEREERITLDLPLRFYLIEELSTVGGWHGASESRIYANEVLDMRLEPLVVRAKKEGIIASGLWADIEDKVKGAGGRYYRSLYLAYKDGPRYALGCLHLKGTAVSAWFRFCQEVRDDRYLQAVAIEGTEAGKSGGVTFQVPVFALHAASAEADAAANTLDVALQAFLKQRRAAALQAFLKQRRAAAQEDVTPEAPEVDDPDVVDESTIPF